MGTNPYYPDFKNNGIQAAYKQGLQHGIHPKRFLSSPTKDH
jgi:hypothetical protein